MPTSPSRPSQAWVTVFSGSWSELIVAQSMLEAEGLLTRVPDENTKVMDPFITGVSPLVCELQVPADSVQLAQERLAARLESPGDDGEFDEPVDYGDITPTLTYADAPAAIEFLCRAFGFRKRLVVPGPDGTVMHSELTFGNGVIMVSSPKPEMQRMARGALAGTCQGICVVVADPDAHHDHAVQAGARVVQELQDEHYGGRGYTAADPENQIWYFGSYRPGPHWDQGRAH